MFFKEYKFLMDSIDNIGVHQFFNKGELYQLYLDESEYNEDFNPYPERKLKNAIKSFGSKIESDEKLLILFDTTLFGSASEGIILTDRCIYVKNLFEDPVYVRYEDIDSILISRENGAMKLINHSGEAFQLALIREC